jgi:selenocysteine-specific elongation factor
MRHVVVGTAGHIDHGKSTLVQALTGVDPDRLKEEKARGITIDLGFAHAQIGDVAVAFVDVPGHERFVKNMLAGAGGIDAVLLVVAADEGVMPQTREHLDICRLLGVSRGVVALTKADLADADMRDLVQLDVNELLHGTALASAPVVAVSARTGAGLDQLRAALAALADAGASRDPDAAVRLPIDRVFTMRGFGTVVTGTLSSGRISPDDALDVLPEGRPAKVRGVQVHGGSRTHAEAGERVAANLAGVEVADLARGQVLATPGSLPVTAIVDAAVTLLASAKPLKHGTRVRFHQGTSEVLARVATVGPMQTGAAPLLQPGQSGLVRLRLETRVPITRGDRYVLRSYSPSVTIAGGRVLDPLPPRGGVRAAATLDRLTRLWRAMEDTGGEADALVAFVEGAGAQGITVSALRARAGASTTSGANLVAGLAARPEIWRVGERLVLASWRAKLEASVAAALRAHHDSEPHSEGLAREQVREGVLGRAHPEIATAVLDGMIGSGAITGRDRLALAGRGVALSDTETRGLAVLEDVYAAAGLTPPEGADLESASGLTAAELGRLTPLLVRQGRLIKVSGLLFHRDALARLRAEVAALKATADPRVDVATFKQRYGLTRKHAIPLLEYLDRERVTRRVGESRVVL